jgi:CheY-like chemotaxis protein
MTGFEDRTYRILVFEDNPADVYLIELALDECGYRCRPTVATSHAVALKLVETDEFDLMLSDFISGCEEATHFMRSVRTKALRLPIIVLSGFADPARAYEAGANAFVGKTSDLKEFFGKIQGLMRFWLSVAELPTPVRESRAPV